MSARMIVTIAILGTYFGVLVLLAIATVVEEIRAARFQRALRANVRDNLYRGR